MNYQYGIFQKYIKNINDPKISKDIKNIRGLANNFLKKWKGKINDLSPSDFLICINEYQEINEAIYKIATHSSLTFATNMEDPRFQNTTHLYLIKLQKFCPLSSLLH